METILITDNDKGVITHLEPDILECQVKWALGSITTNKASGGDGIPAELFQILKDDAALNMSANLENSSVATILKKKKSVFIPISKKGNGKECSNCHTIALIPHASKVMLKILLNSTWTKNFQMFKLDLEKAEEPEIKLPESTGSQKKQENSRKTSTSVSLTMLKPLCGSQQTVENS